MNQLLLVAYVTAPVWMIGLIIAVLLKGDSRSRFFIANAYATTLICLLFTFIYIWVSHPYWWISNPSNFALVLDRSWNDNLLTLVLGSLLFVPISTWMCWRGQPQVRYLGPAAVMNFMFLGVTILVVSLASWLVSILSHLI